MSTGGSTVPRRQLGKRLAALRRGARLTLSAAASEVERSESTLSRIEAGKVPVRAMDVRALCRLYRASAEDTEILVELAKKGKEQGRWYPYGDLMSPALDLFVALEEVASSLDWYEPELIPGPMQTPAYAHTVISAGYPGAAEDEIQRRVNLRTRRQSLLSRPGSPTAVRALLNEAVLRRPVPGHKAMADQLRHVVRITQQLQVAVRVLPWGPGVHLGALTGQFVSMRFPCVNGVDLEPPTVFSDGYTGSVFHERSEDVARYVAAFESMWDRALSDEDTRDLMRKVADDYDNSAQ